MSEVSRRKLIALATYNEMENLPRLVDALSAVVPDADILIVDDDSPDGTGRWALDASEKNPRISAIVRRGERGLGTAVACALKHAITKDYDRVVNMDADFSHSVETVPKLFARLDSPDVDVAIGSRYVPGGATPDWPFKRRLMSRAVNGFARLTLGLTTRDNSGSFRCYRVETLRKLDFDAIVSTGYSFFEELLFRLKREGARFVEIPTTFVDRRFGVSKIDRREALRAVAIMTRLGASRLFSRGKRRGVGR